MFTVNYTVRQTAAATDSAYPAQCNFVPVVNGSPLGYQFYYGIQVNGPSDIDYPASLQFILVNGVDYTAATTSIYLAASVPNGGDFILNAQATGPGGPYNTGGVAAGVYANLF